MSQTDRRERVALDEAYEFYRRVLRSEEQPDLHRLANSLKTVYAALDASERGQLQLTARLWMRMRQALFDKLLTTFPSHLVVIDTKGAPVKQTSRFPEQGTLQIHPEGLRRDDDFFSLSIDELHHSTRSRLGKIWAENRPSTSREDFSEIECGDGVCTPKLFVIGDEVLQQEASHGKLEAHKQWWNLYWQSYCTPDRKEKHLIDKEMASLEHVWGRPAAAS